VRSAEGSNENANRVAPLATGRGLAGAVLKNGGGHVVPLAAFFGEFLDGRENVSEKIERRVFVVPAADVQNAREAKL
jgi:hypothetical protein